MEYLPAYAPELNPVEYIWSYLKHHAMPNFCARDLSDLRQGASRSLRSMQRRGTLVTPSGIRRSCSDGTVTHLCKSQKMLSVYTTYFAHARRDLRSLREDW